MRRQSMRPVWVWNCTTCLPDWLALSLNILRQKQKTRRMISPRSRSDCTFNYNSVSLRRVQQVPSRMVGRLSRVAICIWNSSLILLQMWQPRCSCWMSLRKDSFVANQLQSSGLPSFTQLEESAPPWKPSQLIQTVRKRWSRALMRYRSMGCYYICELKVSTSVISFCMAKLKEEGRTVQNQSRCGSIQQRRVGQGAYAAFVVPYCFCPIDDGFKQAILYQTVHPQQTPSQSSIILIRHTQDMTQSLLALLVLDERIFVLVILVEQSLSIIVKEEFLSFLDIPRSVEGHLDSALSQHVLRVQIFLPVIGMVDEAGGVAHEPGIDGALGRSEVIEAIIDTETFPEEIDAVVYQFARVDHQHFACLDCLSGKQPQACLAYGGPSYFDSFELPAEDGVVATSLLHSLSEATATDERITLGITTETDTFLSSAVQFLTPTASLPDGTSVSAEALGQAVLPLPALAGVALWIYGHFSSEVVGAGCDGEVVFGMGDLDASLPLPHRLGQHPLFVLFLPREGLRL